MLSHPKKTDKDNPRWYMVDVKFVSRLEHFVPLAVLKNLGELEYLRNEDVEAIGGMALINKGRLSVQPVSALAYAAVATMGARGGFEPLPKRGKRKAGEVEGGVAKKKTRAH